MAIHLAFSLAFVETLALVALLGVWGDRVAGARLLQLFLAGVALWMVGNELPSWWGPSAEPLALGLLSTASLTSSVFLHFCLVVCGLPARRGVLAALYGLGVAATVLSVAGGGGQFEAVAGVGLVPVPDWAGWITSWVWAGLGGLGVLVLLRTWTRSQGALKPQLAAVALSCGWGLFCMTGYGIVALRLPYYPWPLLGLPAYPVILVYGILRYRVFVANAWARRALAWAILLALGLGVVALSLLLPVSSRWLGGLAVAATCLALNGPVRRVAERLVYPGGTVSAADLAAWRQRLAATESMDELAAAAAEVLGRRLGTEVSVSVGGALHGGRDAPLLQCDAGIDGAWTTRLVGWDSAPPGPRHAAELFGAVLAEVAPVVALVREREQRERERQLQARLAELGSLAAAVAHDVRNPLNIISMAVALAPADTRREVSEQVQRISRLTADLLDYAKPWQLSPVPFDLAARVKDQLRRMPEVQLGAGLQQPVMLQADPARIDQALANLLSNARAAAGERQVLVDAEQGPDRVLLHVCDDGPGVPADLRDRLFQPFASRSPGGTGLGLAIVARILAAHGGSAELTERPPWSTCFTLSFPRNAP